MLTYELKKAPGVPLYEALYRCIRGDILSGQLKAGQKLPSKRALAAHLNVILEKMPEMDPDADPDIAGPLTSLRETVDSLKETLTGLSKLLDSVPGILAGLEEAYAGLTQAQLAHTAFPLGELTKDQARSIAEEKGFVTARKKDSQDICFVPDGDYFSFLQRFTGKTYESGDFLDLNGKVVGNHKGAVGYTLGQRKGLGLAMGAPVYVCAKDMQANTVTVGPNEALFASVLRANDWNWIAFESLTEPIRVMAKARSRMAEQPATVYPEENGFARVEFETPQRAVTPGQAVVLYCDDLVVGGGTICAGQRPASE